jgi:hypothetical protein
MKTLFLVRRAKSSRDDAAMPDKDRPYLLRFTGARGLIECSTSTTAKRRDVITRVFGQNRRLVNTGDDVRRAVSALRRDPRKRVC